MFLLQGSSKFRAPELGAGASDNCWLEWLTLSGDRHWCRLFRTPKLVLEKILIGNRPPMSNTNTETLLKLISRGDWQAIDRFLNEQETLQDSPIILLARGLVVFHLRGNQLEGLQLLQEAHGLLPNDTRIANTLADLLVKSGRAEAALKLSLKTVESHPKDPLSLHALAVAYFATERFSEAHQTADRGINLTADLPPALKASFKSLIRRSSPVWRKPLRGKHLELTRLESKHFEFLLACRRNSWFQHRYNLFKQATEEAVKADIRRSQKSPADSKKIEWVIEKQGNPIGLVSLVQIDFNNRRAEIQIGFPEERRFSEALEAFVLALDFAFIDLQFHKVYSYIYSDNEVAQKNSENFGFHVDGLLIDHVWDKASGTWLSLNVNSLLQKDYIQSARFARLRQRVRQPPAA